MISFDISNNTGVTCIRSGEKEIISMPTNAENLRFLTDFVREFGQREDCVLWSNGRRIKEQA